MKRINFVPVSKFIQYMLTKRKVIVAIILVSTTMFGNNNKPKNIYIIVNNKLCNPCLVEIWENIENRFMNELDSVYIIHQTDKKYNSVQNYFAYKQANKLNYIATFTSNVYDTLFDNKQISNTPCIILEKNEKYTLYSYEQLFESNKSVAKILKQILR